MSREGRTGLWRPIALVVALIGVAVVSHWLGLGARLAELRHWIASLGSWGPVVFVALYAIATVAALPGSALSIAAATLFGSVVGVLVVAVGATLGASLAFLVSRYFAREATARWLSRSEKFKRLDELTEKHGAAMVALTRLVPLFPFNLLNYGFGLTRVRFGTYVLYSAVCMLPGIVLYVVGASAVVDAYTTGQVPVVAILVVLVLAVALFLVGRQVRARLGSGDEDAEGSAETEERAEGEKR